MSLQEDERKEHEQICHEIRFERVCTALERIADAMEQGAAEARRNNDLTEKNLHLLMTPGQPQS